MPDATVVDQYPKSTTTQDEVNAIRQDKLDNGATSSVLTSDAINWILTTVWPG